MLGTGPGDPTGHALCLTWWPYLRYGSELLKLSLQYQPNPNQACSLRISAAETTPSLLPLDLPKINYTLAMGGWTSSLYPLPSSRRLVCYRLETPESWTRKISCGPFSTASVSSLASVSVS